MIEIPIGFDARYVFRLYAHLWTCDRIHTQLIRKDVASPLSVDEIVWPSVFSSHNANFETRKDFIQHEIVDMDRPSWSGCVQSIWNALSYVEYVGISLCVENATCSEYREWSEHGVPAGMWQENEIFTDMFSEGWELLGYDIADGFLTSALMNMGIGTAPIGNSIQSHLNMNHLVDHADAAREIKHLLATKHFAAGHSPLYVYGLRRKLPLSEKACD